MSIYYFKETEDRRTKNGWTREINDPDLVEVMEQEGIYQEFKQNHELAVKLVDLINSTEVINRQIELENVNGNQVSGCLKVIKDKTGIQNIIFENKQYKMIIYFGYNKECMGGVKTYYKNRTDGICELEQLYCDVEGFSQDNPMLYRLKGTFKAGTLGVRKTDLIIDNSERREIPIFYSYCDDYISREKFKKIKTKALESPITRLMNVGRTVLEAKKSKNPDEQIRQVG